MKKIFICLFMLLSLLTFTSCSNTNVTSDDQAKTPLATPALTLSGNIASWNQISGAVNYELSLDGETSNTNITTYTFNQTEPGTYKLKVRALASNDSNFTNSDYSNEVAYTVEAKDTYTRGHSDRVSEFSVLIGKYLNLPQADLDTLRIGGLFHDIRKNWCSR